MQSDISATEQVLVAILRHLQKQLMTDPNCNTESILETSARLEATLLGLDDAHN